MHLRLKLFDGVVTPAVCYSLSTTPLTSTQVSRLDAAQRKMLRKLVGWVRFEAEDWETTGQRMKARLEAALSRHPIKNWSKVRQEGVDRLMAIVDSGSAPDVVQLAYNWCPRSTFDEHQQTAPYRGRGRPRQRWTS